MPAAAGRPAGFPLLVFVSYFSLFLSLSLFSIRPFAAWRNSHPFPLPSFPLSSLPQSGVNFPAEFLRGSAAAAAALVPSSHTIRTSLYRARRVSGLRAGPISQEEELKFGTSQFFLLIYSTKSILRGHQQKYAAELALMV